MVVCLKQAAAGQEMAMGAQEQEHTLPVDRQRNYIRNTVYENRVTIIIGKTGCGKSSRVPQMLLEELGGTILCSQPRRLAVVAIANRVAQQQGVALGTDIGYRIGQQSVAHKGTKLLFTTAGLLLEELRANGPAALRRCSCLLIDELHERSCESDLLLASVKGLLEGQRELGRVKLVLMSATADVNRYREYFHMDGERVASINVDTTQMLVNAVGAWLDTVQVHYLDKVVSQVLGPGHPRYHRHQLLLMQHKAGLIEPAQQVGSGMHEMIADLIFHIHENEADPSGVIMVFLPTYKALEYQYDLLRGRMWAAGEQGNMEVYPLHSSIDISEAMKAIQSSSGSGRRKLILATNVAESSVTIPDVKHVIDSCTANQVFWDRSRQRESAEVVWASQSQAEQRKGRTGRTCTGTVYRLVPRDKYLHLPRWESPALVLRSLRRETCVLLSAQAKPMADAAALLASTMDPPDPEVVSEALNHLVQLSAAEAKPGGKYAATQLGRMLAAMPLDLDSALMVVRGGRERLLWEAAVLASIANNTPYPIRQPFGEGAQQYVRQYAGVVEVGEEEEEVVVYEPPQLGSSNGGGVNGYHNGYGGVGGGYRIGVSGGGSSSSGGEEERQEAATASGGEGAAGVKGLDRAAMLLANLAAFEAWQKYWGDRERLRKLLQQLQGVAEEGGPNGVVAAAGLATGVYGDAASDALVCASVLDMPHDSAMGGNESSSSSRRSLQGASSNANSSNQQQQGLTAAAGTAAAAGATTSSSSSRGGTTATTASVAEVAWCTRHHLIHASLANVADTLAVVLAVVHQFRPSFLHLYRPPQQYYQQQRAHVCSGGQECDGCRELAVQKMHGREQRDKLRALLSSPASKNNPADLWRPLDDITALQQQQQRRQHLEEEAAPVCRFFLMGGCRRGISCGFRHERPLCKYVMALGGCMYGDECRFSHDLPRNGTNSSCSIAPPKPQLPPLLTFDWSSPTAPVAYEDSLLNPSGSSGKVLLLGEGDFGFTRALLTRRSGLRLIATTLESEQQLARVYPGVMTLLGGLKAIGVQLVHGVDATQLPRGFGGAVDWTQVDHIVWNFPLVNPLVHNNSTSTSSGDVPAGAAAAAGGGGVKFLGDDEEANRKLLGEAFAAISRVLMARNGDTRVHIALCLDQYGRWGVQQLARDAFLFLESSAIMRLPDWPGYVPRACDGDDGFPADRAVVYTFRLAAPLGAGLVSSRELVDLERQLQQQEREKPQLQEQQQGVTGRLLAGAALPADEGELLGGAMPRGAAEAVAAVAAADAAVGKKGKKTKAVTGSLRGLSQGLGIK